MSPLRFLAISCIALGIGSYLESCSTTPRTVRAQVKPDKERKPAPEFFAAVCRHTGCQPNRILFIGDDFVNDYEGAHTAGLQASLPIQRFR